LPQLDFPACVLAWQHLRRDVLPAVRAELAADRVYAGSQVFDDVSLRLESTSRGTDLLIDSAAIAGIARWAVADDEGDASAASVPVEIHLTRLDLPPRAAGEDAAALLGSLGPNARIAIDELGWRGRSLGRLTAALTVQRETLAVDDLRLSSADHEGRGALRCRISLSQCRMSFKIDSSDASGTLLDFGLAPDVTAQSASVSGDVEWQSASGRSWIAGLRGALSLSLADGAVRSAGQRLQGQEDARPPFALLAVPALVRGLDAAGSAANPLTGGRRDLRFTRLEADFDLADGSALTSNLHFDGDAEILMRGRTGLLTRDYEQEVWILRGEDRLPAPVRRFGATPRVAAAWLSLRDLLSGRDQRAGAVLRLQGSWDDPMVVPES
jgi:uncharacterized protein YhdP